MRSTSLTVHDVSISSLGYQTGEYCGIQFDSIRMLCLFAKVVHVLNCQTKPSLHSSGQGLSLSAGTNLHGPKVCDRRSDRAVRLVCLVGFTPFKYRPSRVFLGPPLSVLYRNSPLRTFHVTMAAVVPGECWSRCHLKALAEPVHSLSANLYGVCAVHSLTCPSAFACD